MAAWCELRRDFRSFRLDRMREVVVMKEPHESAPGRTLEDFFRYVAANAIQNGAKARARETL
jgi:predicted DNA-binding transcriptional regulator YafY